MNIAIAGAGISGAYLGRLLARDGMQLDLYDTGNQDTACGCRSCGWGAPVGIERYLADVDLCLDDYLIDTMSSMTFEGLAAKTPLCTINKPSLLRDLRSGLTVLPQALGTREAVAYDIIVDATGISRAFLPPCRSELVMPAVQHRVIVESLGNEPPGAAVSGNRIPGLGYLWIFPLGGGEYHIGVGGIRLDTHERIMEQFFQELAKRYRVTPVCSCRGVVRLASPYYSTPFHVSRLRGDGKQQLIIGVGEAIGTVSPFTGEGIIYSLDCARLLARSFPDQKRYASEVMARFRWMKKERETIDYLLSDGKITGPRLRDRWRFFRNARRSGIRLPLIEAFRRMGSLSRWVDNP
jgi:flavin-dependent dehydrogenase